MIQQSIIDKIGEAEVFDVLVEVYTDALPLPIVALLVFGPIGISYYLLQDRIIIPVIMLVLIGGVTIARVPVTFAGGILAAVTVAVAGLIWLLFRAINNR